MLPSRTSLIGSHSIRTARWPDSKENLNFQRIQKIRNKKIFIRSSNTLCRGIYDGKDSYHPTKYSVKLSLMHAAAFHFRGAEPFNDCTKQQLNQTFNISTPHSLVLSLSRSTRHIATSAFFEKRERGWRRGGGGWGWRPFVSARRVKGATNVRPYHVHIFILF